MQVGSRGKKQAKTVERGQAPLQGIFLYGALFGWEARELVEEQRSDVDSSSSAVGSGGGIHSGVTVLGQNLSQHQAATLMDMLHQHEADLAWYMEEGTLRGPEAVELEEDPFGFGGGLDSG